MSSAEYQFAVIPESTRNWSGDEIANVNFLYDDIVHVLYDSSIGLLHNEAYMYTVGHKKTHQNVFGHNFRKTGRILNKFGRLLPK